MRLVGMLFIILALCPCKTVYGQSQAEEALQLGRQAIQLMNSGSFEEAIGLLQKAQKLDPENSLYPYEIGYAHYAQKEYDLALKIVAPLLTRPNPGEVMFQLVGNCYDHLEQPDKAITVYDRGLELFPESGRLHLEQGVLALNQKKMQEALTWFERGIEQEPQFPSNYYWAAKLYADSTEKIWGLLYGEIFMNLERGSKRTEEISKLLFDTYVQGIQFETDTTVTVNLSQTMALDMSNIGSGTLRLPYSMVYEPTLALSVVSEREITLASLDRIRDQFVKIYQDRGFMGDYPNVVLEYHQRLREEGHFAAYNHWLFMKGAESEFADWANENGAAFSRFIEWFRPNPLAVSKDHRFHRNQY